MVDSDVRWTAEQGLARAGFAVIGFTDIIDRDIVPGGGDSTSDAFATLLSKNHLPDYLSLLTHAEQLAMLRMIPTLGSIDVLPLGAPDGVPDVDPSLPLGYFGNAHGAAQGCGLLAFAPEIHAAALVGGAGRFTANLMASFEALYQAIAGIDSAFMRVQLYAGLGLTQMDYDHQDPQNLGEYVYRQRLPLEASARASILMVEGLSDTWVPSYAVRSGAAAIGIPLTERHGEDIPFLGSAAYPVQANIDSSTTAALIQFVPKNYPSAAPTTSCAQISDGHSCAVMSSAAFGQRTAFFASALAGVPAISRP
jgi:hypothetical protein